MLNQFTKFAKHQQSKEVLGVYSDEGDTVYLVPKRQWEDDKGTYDNEYICSTAYPVNLFTIGGPELLVPSDVFNIPGTIVLNTKTGFFHKRKRVNEALIWTGPCESILMTNLVKTVIPEPPHNILNCLIDVRELDVKILELANKKFLKNMDFDFLYEWGYYTDYEEGLLESRKSFFGFGSKFYTNYKERIEHLRRRNEAFNDIYINIVTRFFHQKRKINQTIGWTGPVATISDVLTSVSNEYIVDPPQDVLNNLIPVSCIDTDCLVMQSIKNLMYGDYCHLRYPRDWGFNKDKQYPFYDNPFSKQE